MITDHFHGSWTTWKNRLDKKSHWICIVNLIKLKTVFFLFTATSKEVVYNFSVFSLCIQWSSHDIRIINDGNAWNLINYITFQMFFNKCFVLSHIMVHTLLIHTQSVFPIEIGSRLPMARCAICVCVRAKFWDLGAEFGFFSADFSRWSTRLTK